MKTWNKSNPKPAGPNSSGPKPSGSNSAGPIRPKQVQLIHIAVGQLGMDDDAYRDRLAQEFGPHVTSCKQLTSTQAGRLIEVFKQMGFTVRPGARKARPRKAGHGVGRYHPGVVRLASRAELDKIAALADLIEWRVEDGPARWMKKRFGIARVKTAENAWQVIEGLKKMFENRMKRQYGPEWWVMEFDDARIGVYQDEHCPVRYQSRMRGNRQPTIKDSVK